MNLSYMVPSCWNVERKQTVDGKIPTVNSRGGRDANSPVNPRSRLSTENIPGTSGLCKRPTQKLTQGTHSDGSIVKGSVSFKQKLVNRVRTWKVKRAKHIVKRTNQKQQKDVPELITDFEGLTLSPEPSEDNLFKSDWLKARDSLENLISLRCDKGEIVNSKSTHFPSSEKPMLNESPCSESQIGSSKAMNSVSRVLAWDPWDKLGRKSKKENKRRKREKSPSGDNSSTPASKDHTSGDELRNGETSSGGNGNGNVLSLPTENTEGDDYHQVEPAYAYQPYSAKNVKAVEFINEVMVVYITGDEVVGESTEPLKKELDQQIRNKEMRKGHYPATLFGRRKFDEDYMSAWLKK